MKFVSLALAGALALIGALLIVVSLQLYYDTLSGGGAELSPLGCAIFGTLILALGSGSLYAASRLARAPRTGGFSSHFFNSAD